MVKREGWGHPSNSPKWHYFVDGVSLCRKWMFLGGQYLEQGGNNSPDNCKRCREALERRRAALAAENPHE